MNVFLRAFSLVSLVALTACGSTATVTRPPIIGMASAPVSTAPTQPQVMSPSQQVAVAAAFVDVNQFVDPTALTLMSARDKTEAANAQYYALQFGRVGAPRTWKGDSSANGNVTVGGFITVNSLECRNFTHAVTISGKAYSRQGTACRQNGIWTASAAPALPTMAAN